MADDGPRLLRALTHKYGHDAGEDLYGDVLLKAWADWTRIGIMDNPAGYLWRVSESSARRYDRWARRPPAPDRSVGHHSEFTARDLSLSLDGLSLNERVAVVMVHGHHATYKEVADHLGVPVTTVTNLLHRGTKRLRHDLRESV